MITRIQSLQLNVFERRVFFKLFLPKKRLEPVLDEIDLMFNDGHKMFRIV